MVRHRHRRGPYAVTEISDTKGVRRVVAILILVAVVWFMGSKVLTFFGVSNTVHRNAVTLHVIGRGSTNVSLENGPLTRAEHGLKLYTNDRVAVGSNASAALSFFDTTWISLDEATDIIIQESARGSEKSELSIALSTGTLWVATPSLDTYSGGILRVVETDRMKLILPSQTEAVISTSSLTVFAAQGQGIEVYIPGHETPVIVGEGQAFTLSDDSITSRDLYTYRSALDPSLLQSSFVEVSRKRYRENTSKPLSVIESETPLSVTDVLTVNRPLEGESVATSTVTVSGQTGQDVTLVRVNGYKAIMDPANYTYSQELTLPDEDSVSILVEALDKDGITIGQIIRTINRDRKPPDVPEIIGPAGEGQIYRTQKTQIEIHGKTSPNTLGIEVNDYRLQLFTPGDEEWSYLADTKFDNFKPGVNDFKIVAINKAGLRSEPAHVTVILGEGPEGVLDQPPSTDEPSGGGSANKPSLLPGSLSVISPTPGNTHVETSTGVLLIEGKTSPDTYSITVNDYRLSLYESGKDFWNYIASIELQTLRRGENTYNVIARDKDGKVLDRMTYTIIFKPGRGD